MEVLSSPEYAIILLDMGLYGSNLGRGVVA